MWLHCRSKNSDPFSRKVLDFKFGSFDAKQFWLNHFLAFYDHLFNKGGNELMIQSLSHKEVYSDSNLDYKYPLGYLCYRISKTVNCRYAPGMIYIIKSTPALKGLNKEERWETVKDNFVLGKLFAPEYYKTIWFIDDVITTGVTARATWKAILDFYPDINFKVIALARTVREQDYNLNSTILNPEINKYNILREQEGTYFGKKIEPLEINFDNSDTFFK